MTALQLTRILYEMLASYVRRPRLRSLEQIGMIAAFTKLHHNVEKPRPVSSPIHSLNVLLQKSCVVLLLHLAHPDLQNCLLLGRQTLLNIALEPAEEEGPQDLHLSYHCYCCINDSDNTLWNELCKTTTSTHPYYSLTQSNPLKQLLENQQNFFLAHENEQNHNFHAEKNSLKIFSTS
jgi:hypothetical protein